VNSFARASGTSRTAAAPSLTGEQCRRRSGTATIEDAGALEVVAEAARSMGYARPA